jgi:hypothetical protein
MVKVIDARQVFPTRPDMLVPWHDALARALKVYRDESDRLYGCSDCG